MLLAWNCNPIIKSDMLSLKHKHVLELIILFRLRFEALCLHHTCIYNHFSCYIYKNTVYVN